MKADGFHLYIILASSVSSLAGFKFLVIGADWSDADAQLSRHKFIIASGDFTRRADRLGIAHARACFALLLAFCWHRDDKASSGPHLTRNLKKIIYNCWHVVPARGTRPQRLPRAFQVVVIKFGVAATGGRFPLGVPRWPGRRGRSVPVPGDSPGLFQARSTGS